MLGACSELRAATQFVCHANSGQDHFYHMFEDAPYLQRKICPYPIEIVKGALAGLQAFKLAARRTTELDSTEPN